VRREKEPDRFWVCKYRSEISIDPPAGVHRGQNGWR
jgi:hypothetical protein